MQRVEAGHYRLEIGLDVFEVTKNSERVETGKSEKGTYIETWTPTLNGDQKPFGCLSYENYRGAREAVYTHIAANYPDV